MAKKAKAKPKSSTRKSSARKSKGESRGGLVVGLIGIIAILGVIVSYYFEKEDATSHDVGRVTTEKAAPQTTSEKPKESTATDEPVETKTSEKVETKETNPDLPDYSDADEYYYTSSFDFAWPAYDVDDIVVEHEGFTISYDERNEQAKWVAYKLERRNLENARFKRKDNFREDKKIRTGSSIPADYKNSGYDRGHLAPAADFTWSESALGDTFYMSNMSPQVPGFNRGIWKKLEEQVRDWGRENNIIYVVTGPIVKSRDDRIGKNKVTIPQAYYKVILDIQEPELKAIAFIMNNEKSDKSLFNFAVSVDKVEEVTGLDFFPSLPDEIESKLEGSLKSDLWK